VRVINQHAPWRACIVAKIRCRASVALLKACLISFLCLQQAQGLAVEPSANPPTSKVSTAVPAGQIVDIVLALVAILLLIAGIAWFVKRFMGVGPQGSQHIRTIAVMPVGNRERIAVVQIGTRQIVVGITPNQITNLLELDQPLDISPSGGEFARKLQTLLNRNESEAKGEANGVQKQT
jgi:flagellar protein FliO/FliZ